METHLERIERQAFAARNLRDARDAYENAVAYAIVAGLPDATIAQLIGVSRQTVWRKRRRAKIA
jgi:FixJ family two-component response regulator